MSLIVSRRSLHRSIWRGRSLRNRSRSGRSADESADASAGTGAGVDADAGADLGADANSCVLGMSNLQTTFNQLLPKVSH